MRTAAFRAQQQQQRGRTMPRRHAGGALGVAALALASACALRPVAAATAVMAARATPLRARALAARVHMAAGDAVDSSRVYLVGCGPGDPELLTLKAFRLLSSADLVLYDRLVSEDVMAAVNPSAQRIYVGKEQGLHSRPQDQIHATLYHYAKRGKLVVRLKGGDPTVFGRGGEEMEYLEQRGVPVRIVPGITAASGISAALGVPLTHRDHADSVTFVTGHSRPAPAAEPAAPGGGSATRDGAAADGSSAEGGLDIDFARLARARSTLVVYMGLGTLPQLQAGLLAAGLDGSTPSAAIQDGTSPGQRVVRAPLAGLAEAVESAALRSPTLVVIGAVVGFLTDERVALAAQEAARRGDGHAVYADWLGRGSGTAAAAEHNVNGAARAPAAPAAPRALVTAPPRA